jgi:16S rRNA (uracil1498-N3)-methyltransferase
VLRCSASDELQVFDGAGSFYKSKVAGIENKKVIVDLLERVSLNAESPLNLTLVQGILKGEKMDMVIQKATELGVKEIIPAVTERSQIRHTRKVGRWRKIAEEASRQSGRTIIPVVHEPIEFNSLFAVYYPLPSSGFIFWEEGGLSPAEAFQRIKCKNTDAPLNPALVMGEHGEVNSKLFLAVGPEGGFSEKEVNLAASKGLITVSLGKRILRAETAAISAVALIQFLFGDI